MQPDLWFLYRQMLRSRRFEEAVKGLWEKGKISGEMHLGIGEEAIAAGVLAHLEEGDAMALDHRGTSPLVVRGVDLVLLFREFLGRVDGLCSGKGGHMHLFSPDHFAVSSGIVGASGPTAAGFALAAQHLRPQKLAVAFFGDGAMNQGMLMESFNLAVAWKLPVVFVCKNNEWAITTRSRQVSGGILLERARSFGMLAVEVDGSNVEAVWSTAKESFRNVRNGNGPTFILATCSRLEGHFLGDAILKLLRKPIDGMSEVAGPLLGSFFGMKGTSLGKRASAVGTILTSIGKVAKGQRRHGRDPVDLLRQRLGDDKTRLRKLEEEVKQEIRQVVEVALSGTDS